jgi:histone-lysine N-methyltransferase SUV420H
LSKPNGKAKETDKEADGEETEEPEVTRVLRTRPSAHGSSCVTGSPVKPEVPRDERGQPLPTCITCFNILPIIHVDKEVVWGVGKKKEMLECPRSVLLMTT